MGFSISKAFKSVKKAVSGVAKPFIDPVKKALKNPLKTLATGGTNLIFDQGKAAFPYVSSAFTGSKMPGSSFGSGSNFGFGNIGGTIGDMASSALDFYNKYQGPIGAAIDMGTGYLAYKGQADANAKQNKAAVSNAREQMQFQKMMSDTAHQREVRDLRAAGLNPILSGTGGMGASSPSGAMAPVVNEEGSAMASAVQLMNTVANTFKTMADTKFVEGVQTQNTQAQTHNTYQDTILKGSQIQINKHQLPILKQTLNNLESINRQIQSSTKLTLAQKDKAIAEVRVLEQTLKTATMKGEIDASDLGTALEIGKRISTIVGDMPGLSSLINAFKKSPKGGGIHIYNKLP